MTQNLIIINTHLKDADNIPAQKNLLVFLSSKTFKMTVDDIINDKRIPLARSHVKCQLEAIKTVIGKGVAIWTMLALGTFALPFFFFFLFLFFFFF